MKENNEERNIEDVSADSRYGCKSLNLSVAIRSII